MRNELPEFYFFVLPDTGQLVTIRRNEHGYTNCAMRMRIGANPVRWQSGSWSITTAAS